MRKSNLFKDLARAAFLFAAVSVIVFNQPSTAEAEPAKGKSTESTAKKNTDKVTDKVSGLLKGKLIGLKDGEIAEAQLTGKPQYYVLYHSASW